MTAIILEINETNQSCEREKQATQVRLEGMFPHFCALGGEYFLVRVLHGRGFIRAAYLGVECTKSQPWHGVAPRLAGL